MSLLKALLCTSYPPLMFYQGASPVCSNSLNLFFCSGMDFVTQVINKHTQAAWQEMGMTCRIVFEGFGWGLCLILIPIPYPYPLSLALALAVALALALALPLALIPSPSPCLPFFPVHRTVQPYTILLEPYIYIYILSPSFPPLHLRYTNSNVHSPHDEIMAGANVGNYKKLLGIHCTRKPEGKC